MKAIICAAGRGSRLAALTKEYPKALLSIGDALVIEHILDALDAVGIFDVIIVSGYESGAVQARIGNRYKKCLVTHIVNEHFDATDNLYSMFLARQHITDGMLFLNGDTVFHVDILKKFLSAEMENALVVDLENRENHPVVAHIDNGCVVEIGHEISRESHGNIFGIYKLSQPASEKYFLIADEIFKEGPQKGGFFMPLQRMSEEVKIKPFFSNDPRWVNINDENDYKKAIDIFGDK